MLINKFTLSMAGVLGIVLTLSNESRATEFAVLRQRFDHNPTETIQVPDDGTTGGLTPDSLEITVPDSDLPASGEGLLTVDFDPVLPSGSPTLGGDPYEFGLTLTDPTTGELSTQFPDPVTVGFSNQTLPSGLTYGQLSLAYLDENVSPAQWVVQDSALEEDSNGYWDGMTNHFTVFALAETDDVPEPSGLGLIAVALAGLGMRRGRETAGVRRVICGRNGF